LLLESLLLEEGVVVAAEALDLVDFVVKDRINNGWWPQVCMDG
jgi:hypothetical protein